MIVVEARVPWRGADTPIEGFGPGRVHAQAEIDLCLKCPYEKCISCLTGGKGTKRGRPRKAKEDGA